MFNFTLTDDWQNSVLTDGRGFSKGIELFYSLNKPKHNLQISYTLAWAKRQFSILNNNAPFWFYFDRRHSFTISSMYKFSPKLSISAQWFFGSSFPFSVASSKINGISNNDRSLEGYYKTVNAFIQAQRTHIDLYIYNEIYSVRLENLHRLDVAVSYKKDKRYSSKTISFGVYNLYCRLNP